MLSLLCIVVLLCIAVYASLPIERPTKFLYQLVGLFVILFSCSSIDSALLRNIVAIVPVFFIVLDWQLSLFSRFAYGCRFNYDFAMSILLTTHEEAFGMGRLYLRYGMLYLAMLIVPLLFINVDQGLYWKDSIATWSSLVLVVLIFGYSIQISIRYFRRRTIFKSLRNLISNTPFSNMVFFMQAWKDKQLNRRIMSFAPSYQLTQGSTPIDTYVLVIGESARSANMGIYGYARQTTPCLQQESEQLLCFEQAICAAMTTIPAIPLALTAETKGGSDAQIENYADNIVHLANEAGFKTFWLSNQTATGDHSNIITAIARQANVHEWLSKEYDGGLLPLFDEALSQSGKKLIILHLNGSHPPTANRYPSSHGLFDSAQDVDACYDNTIFYTDWLLGQIFDRLRTRLASVMYFSDHGLERCPADSIVYRHGGGKPSLESVHIPMFVWFSHQLPAGARCHGRFSSPFSTGQLYPLMQHWMGIGLQGLPPTMAEWLERYAASAPEPVVISPNLRRYKLSDLAPASDKRMPD